MPSLSDYVGTNIKTLPSEIQNAINTASNTQYNPANPLSTSYWVNTVGTLLKTTENLATGKYNNIVQDVTTYSNLEKQMNSLVAQGSVPWYFPDVANLMIAAPLLVASYGVSPTSTLFLKNVVQGAIGFTAINAITNLLTGKPIDAQTLTQSAVMGGSVGGILSPLSTILPLMDISGTLVDYGIPEKVAVLLPKATQEAFNLGNFFAAVTATQLLDNGIVPTAKQLYDSYFYGAALGAGLSTAGAIAESLTGALEDLGWTKTSSTLTGKALQYGLAGTGQAALGVATGSPLNPLENFAIGVGLSASPDVLSKITPLTVEKASYQENELSQGTTSYKLVAKVPDIIQSFANTFLNNDISSTNLEDLYNELQEANGGIKPTTAQIMKALADNPDLLDENRLPVNPFRYQKTLLSITLGPVLVPRCRHL